MKSKRRHELKQNALAQGLNRVPLFFHRFGAILVIVILVLVAGAITYMVHRNQAADQLEIVLQNMDIIQSDLENLRTADSQSSDPSALEETATRRWSLDKVDYVLAHAPADQPQLKSQALVYRGDLNFAVANLPLLRGARNDSTLRPDVPIDQLQQNAQNAYEQVLQQYPNDILATTAAHMGLAAIAEDRAAASDNDSVDWETARQQYQAVIDSNAPREYKALAQAYQDQRVKIREPVLVDVPPLFPTTGPSSRSSTFPSSLPWSLPEMLPTTTPSTLPTPAPQIVPSTMPASTQP
jgi:cell division protein FtsL